MPETPARFGQLRPAPVLGRAALIALPLVAALAAVFLYNAAAQEELLRRKMALEARRDLDAQRVLLAGSFEQAMRDVLLLAETERLQDMLADPSPRNLGRAEELVLLMVQRKGYDQVRFLDLEGREVVRANHNAGNPAMVLAADLQPKGDRYYVREALALEREAIFVSPLDLNMERGSLEIPLKPTVRICTPVYDRLGSRRGVLVINLAARSMLEALGRGEKESGWQAMLLAQDGHWLKAPDPGLEWGFLFPERRERTFGRAHPQAWAAMQAEPAGVAEAPEGLFVFETVRLAEEARQWPGGPLFSVRQGSRGGGENVWRLASFLPREEVAARTAELRRGELVLVGLCSAVLLLVSGVLALSLERRRAAAEALRVGEERLRLFIRHTPAAVAMFDTQMRYIVASRRWNEDYGLGGRDLTGLSHYEVFPEIGPEWKASHQRVLAGETLRKDEDPFPRADGRLDWVRWVNAPWRRADGSIGGVIMFTEVVTERKRAEEALRESQERLEMALKGGDLGLWDWNVTTGEVHFDERWAGMLGYNLEDLPPTVDTWSRLVHPADMADVTAALTAHLEARSPMYSAEHRLQAKDGSWRWVLDCGKVVSRDPAGKPLRAVGTHQDITERKQAEEALRLSQARLDAVVNTAVDGIITIDTAGVIQTVNPAAAVIFGYTSEEMVGQPVTMLQIEPYRSNHDGYLARYLATGEPRIIGRGGREVPGRRKDGEVFPLELSVSEVRVGEQWFFTGMLRDISERKRLEVELLAAKEQAEAANQAKSEFLARMSHEIRTPMNAVLGLTHLALQTRLDSRQHDYLAKVQTSARLLLGIINDILDFSKIEAGRLELETADFDLDEVLDGLLVVVGQAAEAKGLALTAVADPDVPRLLAGDALRLTQVLVNLMNNAVKFTEQGEVSLRVSRGQGVGPGVPLRCTVRDTGMGMDEAARARLFQSFSQADETITRRFGGTGLGLAISKRLVELMGGSITVESLPGQGSTFTVSVTLAPASGRARAGRGQAPDPAALAAIRGAAVLVVEDNAINRQVVRELLAAAGMRVSEAENGLEAVQAVQDTDFDLALMDVQMPVMDGREAARRIRALGRGGRLPIVAMSASVLPDERSENLAAGMDDHLPKPFTPEALARLLVKWIKPGEREPLPASLDSPPQAPPPPATAALDPARGLASAGGRPDLYRSLLAQFRDEFSDAPARLEAALAAGNPAGARMAAHSLRGVAGNLGAGEVAQAAADMEKALAEGRINQARACLPRLVTALRQSLDAVRLLDADPGKEEEETSRPPADMGEAAGCLDRLEGLLARQDLDADAAAGELARLLAGTTLAGEARKLEDAVARFAYDPAREQIANLRRRLRSGEKETA